MRGMLYNLILAIIFMTSTSMLAQDSTGRITGKIDSLSSNSIVSQKDSTKAEADTLSAIPTFNEIHKLFFLAIEGKKDLFKVVSEIASKGNNAIPCLEQYLNQSKDKTAKRKSPKIKYSDKRFVIYALDDIGTPEAEHLLLKIVNSNADKEIRGLALKTLAQNYYYRTKNEVTNGGKKELKANIEVVHTLYENADDTTYIKCCMEKMGQIAREGLKNWTGQDYGKIPTDATRLKEERKLGMTMKNYRAKWWKKNSSKYTLDKNKCVFKLNN